MKLGMGILWFLRKAIGYSFYINSKPQIFRYTVNNLAENTYIMSVLNMLLNNLVNLCLHCHTVTIRNIFYRNVNYDKKYFEFIFMFDHLRISRKNAVKVIKFYLERYKKGKIAVNWRRIIASTTVKGRSIAKICSRDNNILSLAHGYSIPLLYSITWFVNH